MDFATPITAGKLHSKFAPHVTHLSERMGLFTLIVLGESIIGVVIGMTNQTWNVYSVVVASFGVCISFSIWWLYFTNSSGSAIQSLRDKSKIGRYYSWLYGHFPLVIGITALGVGISHLVSIDQWKILGEIDLWIICGSLAISLIAQIIIELVTKEVTKSHLNTIKRWIYFRIPFIIVILLIPAVTKTFATSLFISFILITVLALQIVLDFYANRA